MMLAEGGCGKAEMGESQIQAIAVNPQEKNKALKEERATEENRAGGETMNTPAGWGLSR